MPEAQIPDATLQGSVLVLLQFDVCEAIRLDQLRTLLQARIADPPGLKHPAQGNVRYQRPGTPIASRMLLLGLAPHVPEDDRGESR